MFRYVLYWVWWISWRLAVSIVAVFSIQHVVYEENHIWIHTNPLLIAMILLILVIRIWSHKPHYRLLDDSGMPDNLDE